MPWGREPCCAPGRHEAWEGSAEHVGFFDGGTTSGCTAQLMLPVLPIPVCWPVPYPGCLEQKQNTGKAACTCAGVCGSADTPGKGMDCLFLEEEVWCVLGKLSLKGSPLFCSEKPSSCGGAVVSELWWVEHTAARLRLRNLSCS